MPLKTLITDSPQEAAALLNQGRLVAFPTETVYGLGAGIDFPDAIARIYTAKGRPADNPLIVHVASQAELLTVAAALTPAARRLVECFVPGPLTLVVRKSDRVPDCVTGGLDTVGVRCPAHPVAHRFLNLCNCPVAAPSANRSGRPSATSWQAVQQDLDGRIDAILRGESSDIGLESTIVDCSGPEPLLLRSGAITLEALQEVLPGIRPAAPASEGEAPKSPGLKYPHYAPRAAVQLLTASQAFPLAANAAWIGIGQAPRGARERCSCHTLEEYANSLFSFFRHCDQEGITTIYCQLPPETGLGRAIRDRLQRAAGQH